MAVPRVGGQRPWKPPGAVWLAGVKVVVKVIAQVWVFAGEVKVKVVVVLLSGVLGDLLVCGGEGGGRRKGGRKKREEEKIRLGQYIYLFFSVHNFSFYFFSLSFHRF